MNLGDLNVYDVWLAPMHVVESLKYKHKNIVQTYDTTVNLSHEKEQLQSTSKSCPFVKCKNMMENTGQGYDQPPAVQHAYTKGSVSNKMSSSAWMMAASNSLAKMWTSF